MFSAVELTLLQNDYKQVPGVTVIDHGFDGPSVALVAVTHGNEISGFESLKHLYRMIQFGQLRVYGRLFLVVHNINAYKAFRHATDRRDVSQTEFRCLDVNLNRIYDAHYFDHEGMQGHYEIQRAKQISKLIPEWEYVLDMHSTSSPSEPMLIYDDLSTTTDMALKLGVKHHIMNIPDLLLGPPLIKYAKKHGRQPEETVALIHESGSHFDPAGIIESRNVMLKFLEVAGSIHLSVQKENESIMNKYDTFAKFDVHHESFTWKNKWVSFQDVQQGTVLATELGEDIVVPCDCKLLMPVAEPAPGVEAIYLMKQIP